MIPSRQLAHIDSIAVLDPSGEALFVVHKVASSALLTNQSVLVTAVDGQTFLLPYSSVAGQTNGTFPREEIAASGGGGSRKLRRVDSNNSNSVKFLRPQYMEYVVLDSAGFQTPLYGEEPPLP